jgi:hypothetical protein
MRVITILCFFVFCCASIPSEAQTKAELKQEKKEKDYQNMVSLVKSGNYEYEAQWANPIGGSRVNLLSTVNFLNFKENQMNLHFPFFGSIQTANIYNSNDIGINFKGEPKKYRIDFNDDKKKITIRFQGNTEGESFDFNLTIAGDGNAYLVVNSSGRSTINYDGILKKQNDE